MHAFTRTRWTALTALLALSFVVSIAATAWGKPAPDYRGRGFRLFARSASAIGGNRVSCGILSTGQVCTDSTGASTAGGGFWPRGSLNQYVFNSGLQIAGVFDSTAPFSWRGTTDGAFFFNARGGGNGTEVTQIYRSSDPDDAANWPAAARVPLGDATADLYAPTLQGKLKASDQDVWFMSWEGDPSRLGGRQHPLGIAVESRGMAFSSAGKEDFIFFVYTFYNVTCTGCYGSARTEIRGTLDSLGNQFQTQVGARFGELMPAAGYSLNNLYVAFGADMDVTLEESGSNYDGVNVPFAMGYTYEEAFAAEPSWKFDPQIYHPPFFAGAGFVGVKYLKSPVVAGNEVGLTLFGATTNGGQFSDPRDTKALYRYLSGTNSAATGDDECNVGDVKITKICFVNQGSAADMRFFQASGPFTLGPGEFSSIVVAYIFSAPVRSGGCTGPSVCGSLQPQVPTGSLTRMNAVDSISNPALCCNTVDTMTGYNGYSGDLNADGKVDQNELITIPGSLLGKGITAQAVFDAKFSQPLPPDAPSFYAVPGDNQVSILWRPSATEAAGDPYYATSQTPLQYDPNYRQFDVAGYRVYRNRSGDPSQMVLLAQYNYIDDGHATITDQTGQMNGADESGGFAGGNEWGCWAPLGIFNTCTDAGTVNGVATIAPITHNIAAEGLVQATSAAALLDGNAIVTEADTLLTGGSNKLVCGAVTCPALSADAGVPFVYVDNTARNNLTYYYTVTAFDANSIRSGPSSLESARVLAKVTPTVFPSNAPSSGSLAISPAGRGVDLTTITPTAPTLDATTGQFSGRQQPPNGASFAFAGQFVPQLFQGAHTVNIILTDLTLGDARYGIDATYTFKAISGTDTVDIPTFALTPPLGSPNASATSAPFPVAKVDSAQAETYKVPTDFTFFGQVTTALTAYQITNSQGRGCADGAVTPPSAFPNCDFFGPRWYAGTNESTPNPNAGNTGGVGLPTQSNAGALPGINMINWPSSFGSMNNGWRAVDAQLGAAIRAADIRVYWGATPGTVDSVMDLTNNVPVPWDSTEFKGGYAFVNTSGTNAAGSFDGRPTVLTFADLGCYEPFMTQGAGVEEAVACSAATPFRLDNHAEAGAISFMGPSGASSTTSPVATNPGFIMVVAGEWFMFELAPGAPLPSNTDWTLRSYIGSIFQNNSGAYTFRGGLRTASAIGAGFAVTYQAQNQLVAPSDPQQSVANVHTVPDPYYVTSTLEQTTDAKQIKFVNLPANATIRIYTTSGVLVQILEHSGKTGGVETWGVRNRNNQFVASGVYFYSVEDADTGARKVGRMTIVQYAR
jgi:hypothetical protein